MSFKLLGVLRPLQIQRFGSKSRFFTNNCLQIRNSVVTNSYFAPNQLLSSQSLKSGLLLSNLIKSRSFSTSTRSQARWDSANSSIRYTTLNRFQQFTGGNNNNSLRYVTILGLSAMAGIFFLSPYIFQYVPPFTYFRTHPKEMVYTILGANLVVFGMWRLQRCWRFLQKYMLLDKSNIQSSWSLVGSAFSHQEIWHLGMNMLALWSFGTSLASVLGASNFFSLYMNSAIAGSLFSLWYPKIARLALVGSSLGASGALFGVFGAFSFLFPQAQILLFIFPIPGGASVAFLGSVIWNAAGCILRWGSFDYAAHLGGSALGLAYGWYISKKAQQEREKRMARFSRWA